MESNGVNSEQKTQICTILGPSGSGKTTLLEKLFLSYQDLYEPINITTTRPKRTSENEGEGYFFTNGSDYNDSENIVNVTLKKDSRGMIMPYKYGISFQELERVKKKSKIGLIACGFEIHDYIAQIDSIDHTSIILETSFLESINRMFKRGDTFDSVRARVGLFGQEIGVGRNLENISMIINNEVELTKEKVQSIHDFILQKAGRI